MRELSAELVQAQEAACRHVARELHDGVGAELTATRFALAGVETWLPADAPPQCAAALAVANRSLDAVCAASRQAVAELHAPSLEAGIVGALAQWTGDFAARTNLRTSFVCAADVRLTRLPADAALAVFRVAQEALNNIAKHARAESADVRIETGRRHLTLDHQRRRHRLDAQRPQPSRPFRAERHAGALRRLRRHAARQRPAHRLRPWRQRAQRRAARSCRRALRGMRCWRAHRAPSVARCNREHAIMSLRILLADDHAVVRQGVRQLLLDRGVAREVTEAQTGAEALEAVAQHSYDVVLLDISLPDMNGVEVLKRLKRKAPRVAVLMFSMYREDQYAVRALKAGAAGYLSKTVDAAQMIGAIQQVAAGRKYVSPAMAEALADYVSFDGEQLPHEKLSDREYQTLCMLASGKRLTDIAMTLSLSVKTVSVYRTRLLEKMKLRNNAELTFYVMSNRLVDLNPAMAG